MSITGEDPVEGNKYIFMALPTENGRPRTITITETFESLVIGTLLGIQNLQNGKLRVKLGDAKNWNYKTSTNKTITYELDPQETLRVFKIPTNMSEYDVFIGTIASFGPSILEEKNNFVTTIINKLNRGVNRGERGHIPISDAILDAIDESTRTNTPRPRTNELTSRTGASTSRTDELTSTSISNNKKREDTKEDTKENTE